MLLLRLLAGAAALLVVSVAARADATEFEIAVSALPGASFKAKTALVKRIAASGNTRAAEVLQAMVERRLGYLRADRRVLILSKDKSVAPLDAITGEALQAPPARKPKSVRTNNTLRKTLRGLLSTLALTDPDPARRLAAAQSLMTSPSAATTAALREALSREQEPEVRDAIRLGLAGIDIRSDKPRTRRAAVAELSGSLHPQALTVLRVAASAEESDDEVRAAAAAAVAEIERQLFWYEQAENLFFGLSLGSVLLLAAVGLAVTFGVMGVINMAHGEMVMIGAYTTFVVQQLMPNSIEASLLIAIPAAFLVAATVGIAIERGVIRFLYGRPLETLLATFGISLILQQAVRAVFSPLNRSVSSPQWMSGALEVNPALALTYGRIYIIVFALLVLVGLALVLKHSRFGLEVRAVTQNRAMARAMGIRTARVDALTFALGSGIAGMAGVALSQLTNVGPNMGQAYIVDSFMVVVFGGVGNLLGTFVGAMSLGVANKFLEPAVGTVLAKILVLIAIILFIQRRPQGLFALRGRSAE